MQGPGQFGPVFIRTERRNEFQQGRLRKPRHATEAPVHGIVACQGLTRGLVQ